MIEDVLVKVDKFIFIVDFIVLDMEEDLDIPLILTIPSHENILNVQERKLILGVQDEQVTFNVFEAMKYPSEVDLLCFQIDTIDKQMAEIFKGEYPKLPLEACTTHSESKS